jgi:hypothetical protein
MTSFCQVGESCTFCHKDAYFKTCDGVLENGARCGKPVCHKCAKIVAHVRTAKEPPNEKTWPYTSRFFRENTLDLCPECVRAGREGKL